MGYAFAVKQAKGSEISDKSDWYYVYNTTDYISNDPRLIYQEDSCYYNVKGIRLRFADQYKNMSSFDNQSKSIGG